MENRARQSICWECSRSVGMDMCCWAEEEKPVEGWEAEKTIFHCNKCRQYESYCVISCPLFKEDEQKKKDQKKMDTNDYVALLAAREKRAKQMDTNGCVALLAAMVERARKDYIDGNIETRCEIECWMTGKDYMIKKLREEAARKDEERYKGAIF